MIVYKKKYETVSICDVTLALLDVKPSKNVTILGPWHCNNFSRYDDHCEWPLEDGLFALVTHRMWFVEQITSKICNKSTFC